METTQSAEEHERPLPIPRVACFCDQVIQGDDGAVSLIRIIDRVEVELREPFPEDLPEEAHIPQRATFFVMLDSIDAWKNETAGFWVQAPEKPFERAGAILIDSPLERLDAANLIFKIDLNLRRPGPYTFELRFGERTVLSRSLTLQVTVRGETDDVPGER